MQNQLDKNLCVKHAITAASYASSVSSGAIDCKGFSEALVLVNFGVAGTTASLTAHLKESASTTAASFAAIAGASFTTVTPTAATNASQIGRLNLRLRKRYLQVHFTTATANGVVGSADVILGNAQFGPVSSTSASALSATFSV